MSCGEMEWRCNDCGDRFAKKAIDERWTHALVKHDSPEAVSFKAVMPWEVDNAE